MKRRIAIVVLAVAGMTAAPTAISAASAASTQSDDTIACVGNGSLIRKAVCIKTIRL